MRGVHYGFITGERGVEDRAFDLVGLQSIDEVVTNVMKYISPTPSLRWSTHCGSLLRV